MYQIYAYEFINKKSGNVVDSKVTRNILTEDVIERICKRLEDTCKEGIEVNRLELLQ